MPFGTYESAEVWTETCGFDGDREDRLLEMLTCKNVYKETV